MLALIDAGPAARVTTTIVCPSASLDTSAHRDQSHLLYHLFVAADRRLFRRQPDPSQRIDLTNQLRQTGTIRVDPGPLAPEVAAAFRDARLDVIVCPVPPASVRADRLTEFARQGIWFYPDLHTSTGSERPFGFAEAVAGHTVITSTLNCLASGRALVVAHLAANRYSPQYTDHRVRWAMATFPARALATVAHSGAAPVSQEVESAGEAPAVPDPPGNLRMPGIVVRFGVRLAARGLRLAGYRSAWSVAWRPGPVRSIADLTRPGPYVFIESPPDRFWADPFPVRDGDTTWLFVEEFPLAAKRAHLAVMELRRDGAVGPVTTVLARPYHLSYPFVFQWRGAWYMVPETRENRSVDLYRSPRFPFEWIKERTLLRDVPAVDATLHEWAGQWWMFTTIAPFGGTENDDLHIFVAETPLGPWRPHPGNPQRSDVRGARSAGRIFEIDGVWYRPTQDCSRRYGSAMTIQRIVTLTEDRFEEEPVARIEPTWAPGLLGTHTINHLDGMTLIDGDRWHPRFRVPVRP